MSYLIENFGLAPGWLAAALVIFTRYALLAGLAFLVFYHWKRRSWLRYKIQPAFPRARRVWREVRHSAITALVFAGVGLGIYGMRQLGWTMIYTKVADYDWGYLAFSFAVLVLAHDTYFYWMHRLIHHPRLFRRLHAVHHHSHNPTPWASLAFHPLEALLEIAIVPVLVCLLPFHPLALLFFATWSFFWNTIGHLGYEIFPKGWVDHPLWRWFNSSTHHNLHHRRGHGNYGLYFNWWDRWMGTNQPDYEEVFRAVTKRREENA